MTDKLAMFSGGGDTNGVGSGDTSLVHWIMKSDHEASVCAPPSIGSSHAGVTSQLELKKARGNTHVDWVNPGWNQGTPLVSLEAQDQRCERRER